MAVESSTLSRVLEAWEAQGILIPLSIDSTVEINLLEELLNEKLPPRLRETIVSQIDFLRN